MRQAFGWQMVVWDASARASRSSISACAAPTGACCAARRCSRTPSAARYEERLERERASLAEAQAVTHLGSWERDLATGTRIWSEEMFRIMGWARARAARRVRARLDPSSPRTATASRRDRGARAGGARARPHVPDPARRRRRAALPARPRPARARRGRARPRASAARRRTSPTRTSPRSRAARPRRASASPSTMPRSGWRSPTSRRHRAGSLLSANQALYDLVGTRLGRARRSRCSARCCTRTTRRRCSTTSSSSRSTPARGSRPRCAACTPTDSSCGRRSSAPSVPGDESPQFAVFHLMDIGERKRFEGQLQHLADHDSLTGLFNRRRFDDELDPRARARRALRRARRRAHARPRRLQVRQRHDGPLLRRRARQPHRAAAARGAARDRLLARLGGDEFAHRPHARRRGAGAWPSPTSCSASCAIARSCSPTTATRA